MKKKHRDITVDGNQYGWIAEPHVISGITKLRIYKDKKVWFEVNTVGIITPNFVKNYIVVQAIKDSVKDEPTPVVKKKTAKKAVKKVAKKAPKKKAKNDISSDWKNFTDLL